MFSLRLYVHLHNVKVNKKHTKALQLQAHRPLHIGVDGKLRFREQGTCFCIDYLFIGNIHCLHWKQLD